MLYYILYHEHKAPCAFFCIIRPVTDVLVPLILCSYCHLMSWYGIYSDCSYIFLHALQFS